MNTARLRAAIHQAVDLVIDALEDEEPAPLAKPPAAPRASRRGAAIRSFVRTTPRDGDTGTAEKILRVKGLL
jgi:hypothetical protein